MSAPRTVTRDTKALDAELSDYQCGASTAVAPLSKARPAAGLEWRPGRGLVFASMIETIGDTPLARLKRLPDLNGVKADILAKRERPHRRVDD